MYLLFIASCIRSLVSYIRSSSLQWEVRFAITIHQTLSRLTCLLTRHYFTPPLFPRHYFTSPLFYRIVILPRHYFTASLFYCAIILPHHYFIAPLFYRIIILLRHYFTASLFFLASFDGTRAEEPGWLVEEYFDINT